MENIQRLHFRAKLKDYVTDEELMAAVTADTPFSANAHADVFLTKKGLLTEGLFRYKNMLFLYMETVDEEILPDKIWPALSNLLYIWPEEKENTPWARMNLVFYFATPEGLSDFTRKTPPDDRCGRIAFLKQDTMFDYVYSHTALVKEGAIVGEKWQSIALHENVLFSYFEMPRLKEINVKRDLSLKSKVIDEWLGMDPSSHFERIDPQNDFLIIPKLYDIG